MIALQERSRLLEQEIKILRAKQPIPLPAPPPYDKKPIAFKWDKNTNGWIQESATTSELKIKLHY